MLSVKLTASIYSSWWSAGIYTHKNFWNLFLASNLKISTWNLHAPPPPLTKIACLLHVYNVCHHCGHTVKLARVWSSTVRQHHFIEVTEGWVRGWEWAALWIFLQCRCNHMTYDNVGCVKTYCREEVRGIYTQAKQINYHNQGGLQGKFD